MSHTKLWAEVLVSTDVQQRYIQSFELKFLRRQAIDSHIVPPKHDFFQKKTVLRLVKTDARASWSGRTGTVGPSIVTTWDIKGVALLYRLPFVCRLRAPPRQHYDVNHLPHPGNGRKRLVDDMGEEAGVG